ncbi:MAG: amidase [Acidimicrobiales bacterium]
MGVGVPDTDGLEFISAVDALTAFAARELSPVELMDAVLAVEDSDGALTQRYADEPRAAALDAEASWAAGTARALEGLPVAVKEDKGVTGKPTSAGSQVFADSIAGGDAPPVAAMRAAGGIFHARTNVPDMGSAGITGSLRYPPTKNPYNPEFNSLGSSGGAAAALAKGLTTLANASDYCGSIRLPAAACGVVGFKPSRGRNAVGAYFNLDWYDHDGAMGRSVADCAVLQNAMAGQQASDLFSRNDWAPVTAEPVDPSSLRVAVSVDLGYAAVDPEIAAATRALGARLEAVGAQVDEVDIGWTDEVLWAYRKHAAVIMGAWMLPYLESDRDILTPYAIAVAETAQQVTPSEFVRSMEIETEMWTQLAPVMSEHNALICPTAGVASVPLDFDPAGPDVDVGGRPVASDYGWMMTYPFNMLSAMPVLNVPSGVAASGVPIGAQLVGRPFDDHGVFALGTLVEQLSPRIGTFGP